MGEPWKTFVVMGVIGALVILGATVLGAWGAVVGFGIGVVVPFVWKRK